MLEARDVRIGIREMEMKTKNSGMRKTKNLEIDELFCSSSLKALESRR